MQLSDPSPEVPLLSEPSFATFAIHDLKGAAHAIQGFLSVLKSERTGPLTEIQRDFISSAFVTARRIERLVDDLQVLEFGNATISVIPESCDLSSIIRMCAQELEPTSIGYNVEMAIQADSNKGWNLVADPVRIEQIVFNLIENAIRYSAVRSTVEIRLRQSRSRVLLIVTNDVAENATFDPERSFLPFQRGTTASTSGRRGLGIGLTVVETLARMHGGTVQSRFRSGKVSIAVILPRRGPVVHATMDHG